MNIKVIIGILVFTVLLLAGGVFFATRQSPQQGGNELAGFAQCLADQKVTMYGAVWCSHCQAQKKLFGVSFSKVPYVECPVETKTCTEKGIKGFPTWIFADGSRLEGELPLKTLSEKTGCVLP